MPITIPRKRELSGIDGERPNVLRLNRASRQASVGSSREFYG
jgi:hypothetical protein